MQDPLGAGVLQALFLKKKVVNNASAHIKKKTKNKKHFLEDAVYFFPSSQRR